jgi:hypothetical protein
MSDLLIYMTGNGGEANLINDNDLELTNGLFNMVLIAMFGGNPDGVTTESIEEGEQRFDWWGNSLFFNNKPEQQFNSYTENLLNNIALTSQSRGIIKGYVLKDLEFLSNLAEIDVNISLLSNDKIDITVKVKELSNIQNSEFQFIWDATKSELIENRII